MEGDGRAALCGVKSTYRTQRAIAFGDLRRADEIPIANVVDRAISASAKARTRITTYSSKRSRTTPSGMASRSPPSASKLLQSALADQGRSAERVIRRIHKPARSRPTRCAGCSLLTIDGKRCVVEYEPDSELRDTETVPFKEPGGIEAFIRREVLPHAPDAWIDEAKTAIGYEISFTRYFYKPQPLRPLEAIRADILALERETEGLMADIIGTGN